MELPETRYAKSGDVNIAYQIVGTGPFDVVWIPGWTSHLDLLWEEPLVAALRHRVASFSRLILFDKRGTGLSDRDVGDSTLEDRMDDVRAVMDAAGSERAAIVGVSEGGPLSILFATTYPQRTRALVLSGTLVAGSVAAPDFGPAQEFAPILQRIAKVIETGGWGRGADLDIFSPGRAGDQALRTRTAARERASASPGTALKHLQWVAAVDCRPIAGLVQAPTLVIHRTADPVCPVSGARWLAAHIPSAELAELPGESHGADDMPQLNQYVDVIQGFLTGSRGVADTDRVLATIMFSDIVESTAKAAALGDRNWKLLLEEVRAVIRRELERYRGIEVDTAGDGFLARFDGPARAVRCAGALSGAIAELGVEVRAGVHTGECEILEKGLAGIAIHVAARIASLAGPREVFASNTVRDLVAGSGLVFDDIGERELKGVPGTWRLVRLAA